MVPVEWSAPNRRLTIGSSDGVSFPVLFYSVSSYETRLPPIPALRLLALFARNRLLVSAFDLYGTSGLEASKAVADCRAAGATVLLDCGNYEADRNRFGQWTVERFHEVLAKTHCDLVFGFDELRPPSDVGEAIGQVLRGLERDMSKSKAPVVPIVHAPMRVDGSRASDLLPQMVSAVVKAASPVMVAVAERELGDGIVARARTVRAIREALGNAGAYTPLHVLGTGAPISIAVLAAAGADSFDGLEWCRGSVDRHTGRMHHFHHQDLFAYQSDLASSPVVREAARDPRVGFLAKGALHNLDFFEDWMEELRAAVRDASLTNFLERWLPAGGQAQVSHALGDGAR